MRHALHLVLAGDLAGAEAALAEAARLDSSSNDVYLALASLYRARGDIGRAIQIHQNLLLRQDLGDPLRRDALLGLALDFRQGGFLRRAAASFEELLESEPRNVEALRELEQIHVQSGRWEEAIRVRRRVGSQDPRTPLILAHLWTGLARQHAKEGREGEARRALRRGLGRDRGCAETWILLGDLRLREGKARKAIGLWGRAIPLHAAIGTLLYPRLWEAYRALDDLAGFERQMGERLAAEPSDVEAAIWRARAVVEQQRIDDGLAELRRLLDGSSDALAARAEIGRVLLRERRDSEALKAFEELLDRLPLERRRLRCESCGTQDTELHWRCPQCGAWDTFV
jgi:lipopolysaccharide biosynthesis regulator YciM